MSKKEYGLILPRKKKEQQNLRMRALNPLLNSDDELERDEDGEEALNWVEASLKKSAGNSGQKSLQKRLLREALEQDSTVFQYDEVYDDIKASQQEQLERRQPQHRKPKYIETILKHSEKRKLENERRQERKVQKEREAEGNEFADKESFVTSSYLKKLEEIKEAEEEERREKILEEKNDVHKHKNFGLFYNHLFKQRIGEIEIKQEPEDIDAAGNIDASSKDASASKNHHEQRKKNYRTQGDLSDEGSPQRTKKAPDIKTEVRTSSDSEDECSKNTQRVEYRHRRINRSPENEGSRSPNQVTSRDKQGRERSNERSRKDRSRSRNRSDILKDRSRRDRSRSNSGRKRSGSKSRNINTRDKDRRELSKSRGKNKRERSREKSKKERSKERNKKERTKETSEKERSGEKRKRNNGSREKENKNKPSGHSLNKTEKGDSRTKAKQSINTTLGSTDINKMKIEDRIKRFNHIFAKRTVGQNFEEALQRYFQRKATREANGLL